MASPCSPTSLSSSAPSTGRNNSLGSNYSSDMASTPPPQPAQPSQLKGRLTRKRAASQLDVDTAGQSRLQSLNLESVGLNGAIAAGEDAFAAREQVCLCQPDPKIPRPRNAFILYRQHMQAQVVTQNPGLANPEISKIIGQQWRKQSAEIKRNWKQLAEEEKQRHQRQYPGYRYQPRRTGKSSGALNNSNLADNGPTHCPKCNGRYISTPSTPLTPFTPGSSRPDRANSLLSAPFIRTIDEKPRQIFEEADSTRSKSPRTILSPHLQRVNRLQYSALPSLHTHYEVEVEMEDLSPDHEQKRRRFNDGRGLSIPTQMMHQPQYLQPFTRHGSVDNCHTPVSRNAFHAPSLPTPVEVMRRPSPHQAGQLEMLHQQSLRHHYPPRLSSNSANAGNNQDDVIRLPPLQTQLTRPSHPAPPSLHTPRVFNPSINHDRAEARESQAKSVEAMVMSISFLNKIKILSSISPPLAPPGPTSPTFETRGFVIAVEGSDRDLSCSIGGILEEVLENDTTCSVKTWDTLPSVADRPDIEYNGLNPSLRDQGSSRISCVISSIVDDEKDPYLSYLDIIKNMHIASSQIKKHITTQPTGSISSTTNSRTPRKNRKVTPIALLPNNFSLTISDLFSTIIPINDSYAPVDHWQWMATLWRGIVGPDLTIYCQSVAKEEFDSFGAVEIKPREDGDGAVIVVRVCDDDERFGIDEKSQRRLAFEVLEFVKSSDGGWGRNA